MEKLLKKFNDSKKYEKDEKESKLNENDGIKLEKFPLSEEDLSFILEKFINSNEKICYLDATRMICFIEILLRKEEESIVNIKIPKNGKIIIVGDLHGQLNDLYKVINDGGYPNEKKYYLFNGDFVDRVFLFINKGSKQC
jgi:hypothetical protein